MQTYQAFDPQSEMTGQSVQGMIKNLLHDDIAKVLARHHLDNIDPNAWYRLQDLLGVLNDVTGQGVNSTSIFVSIGMGAADLGYEGLPPQLKDISLEQFLAAYGARYRTLHHGDVGYVNFEKVSDDHFVLTTKVPYPDDMMYGVFYGFARHLKPKGKGVSVSYDSQQPRRDEGGDVTIIHVKLKD